jgi:hypothetical protein
MFGVNVKLLVLVLFFDRLISSSRIMCWFSFSCLCVMVICTEHRASSVCFISSYVCPLVVCKVFKSAKPPILVLFFPMFILWLFASFSNVLR